MAASRVAGPNQQQENFGTLRRLEHRRVHLRALDEYLALWAYIRDPCQGPASRPTVEFKHIKKHNRGSYPG